MIKRFWISWNEPVDVAQDSRPLRWPLPPSIVQYWKSGEAGDQTYHTLCAVVDALHPGEAWSLIRGAGWYGSEPVRFLEEKPAGWMPDPSRFPPKTSPADAAKIAEKADVAKNLAVTRKTRDQRQIGGRLLRLPAVIDATGMSRSWIYEAMKRECFPAPRRLGGRSVAWAEDEVRAWIANRPLQTGPGGAK